MRPIKLSMTAFGPYAGTEIVDFRDAVASGLFGIYGATGSGKSTIFSAMTFALFGELARSEQDAVSVRSDHAESHALTQVEFVFEVGSARYLIRRTPDQMRPALRGDGETKDVHKAWLFDVTGIEPDDITPENTGKIIEEKKVSRVKEAIQRLLGYGAEQFKQIVLLPQGKFETFLTAKTDNRLKILRELFDVSLYRAMAHKFKEQAHEAEQAVKLERHSCASRLEQDGFESPDALKFGIDEAKKTTSDASEAAKASTKNATLASTTLQAARQVDASFIASEAAQKYLEEISSKSESIEVTSERLKNARKAKALIDVYDAVKSTKNELQQYHDLQSQAQTILESAKVSHQTAITDFKSQEALTDQRETLQNTIATLKTHSETLENSKAFESQWQIAKQADKLAKAAATSSLQAHQSLLKELEIQQAKLKNAQAHAVTSSALKVELLSSEQILDKANIYQAAHQAVSEANAQMMNSAAKADAAKITFSAAENSFRQAETALASAQAQHLAEKLEDGEPCAVCGSQDHPDPAKGNAESSGLDRAFRDARADLERQRKVYADASQSLSVATARLNDRKAALNKIDVPAHSTQDALASHEALKARFVKLGPAIDIPNLEARISALGEQISEAQSSQAKARDDSGAASTAAALAQQKYNSALQTIPGELREDDALELAIRSSEGSLDAMTNAFKIAEENKTKAREAELRRQKDFESAETAVGKAQAKMKSAETVFGARLVKDGLTQELFNLHRTHILEIEAMEQETTSYKEALVIAKDRAATTRNAIKNKVRPNLIVLRQEYERADELRENAVKQAATFQARTSHLEKLLISIAAEYDRIKKVEEDTKALRELASMFNAANPAKLDLETFAIGAMFDQVLQAANLRLQPMTDGRFKLERELEGKGGGRRGLGIAVHDIYTGTARPTSTLSGGQTFLAALALALGLSDIVESTSGNIRLDTIFIDEGFGSLDAETLDHVLQTLRDVMGQDRTVGLISHVDMVKEAIPNGFTIKATRTGSHVEARSV